MSADPAGPVDGLNLYEYVSGNPVKMVDPEGTQEDDPQTVAQIEAEASKHIETTEYSFEDLAVEGSVEKGIGGLEEPQETGEQSDIHGAEIQEAPPPSEYEQAIKKIDEIIKFHEDLAEIQPKARDIGPGGTGASHALFSLTS